MPRSSALVRIVARRPESGRSCTQHPFGRSRDRGAGRGARPAGGLAGPARAGRLAGVRGAGRHRARPRGHPARGVGFGIANQVTLLRAGLVCLAGGVLLARAAETGGVAGMKLEPGRADRGRAGPRCRRWLARPAAAAGLGVRRPVRRRGRCAPAADPRPAGLAGRAGRRLGAGDRRPALSLRARGPRAALAERPAPSQLPAARRPASSRG